MNVAFVDLQAQYLSIQKEIDKTISDVVTGGHFIHGKQVEQFENAFAKYLGAKYCIGVNSGTDALILGVKALGLKPGDEVIVPVNTFIATAIGVTENGLKPVFVDMDPVGYGMDLVDLRKKITKRTKAILVVHLYGRSDDIDGIKKVIRQSGQQIHLIEDACQAHGAMYLPRGKAGKGRKVGSYGIFSTFSFYPGKNLGAYGDGGAIVTNDKRLYEKFLLLHEYGQKKKYIHESLGINSRLDTLQAAVLFVKLKHLDRWNKIRQRWASYYSENLPKAYKDLKIPTDIQSRQSVYHLYVVETDYRDELIEYLNKHDIQALIHYPIPLHMQKAFSYLGYKKGDFSNAEKSVPRLISLPMHPDLTKKQVDYVIKTIKEYYDKKK